VLQPFVGLHADRHPQPYSLAVGMCFTLVGLLLLAVAPGFVWILLSVSLIGWGSSVFHPESSRVAQLASGGRKGLAQSIFQVGGNAGNALGPLLAALVVIPLASTRSDGSLWPPLRPSSSCCGSARGTATGCGRSRGRSFPELRMP
ncbi:fosmidomycin resistance protein, partial [human gut metagenome]